MQNPVRQFYRVFVTLGYIGILALILFVLKTPVVLRLSLLIVAAIVIAALMRKTGTKAVG